MMLTYPPTSQWVQRQCSARILVHPKHFNSRWKHRSHSCYKMPETALSPGEMETLITSVYSLAALTGSHCTVMRRLAATKSVQRYCFPYVGNSLNFWEVVPLGFNTVAVLTHIGSLEADPAGPRQNNTAFSHSSSLHAISGFGEDDEVVALGVIIWQFYIKAQDQTRGPTEGSLQVRPAIYFVLSQ